MILKAYRVSKYGIVKGTPVDVQVIIMAMNKQDAINRAVRLCVFPIFDNMHDVVTKSYLAPDDKECDCD